jgi:hypothetical protein
MWGFVIFFLLAACFPGAMAAQEVPVPQGQQKGSLNLNVNYPGAALRYFVADGKGLELLGQGQDDVFVGGLRYYCYPKKLRGAVFSPYAAAEWDYLSFKGDYSKGKGWGVGLYAGVEYRLGGRFSLQADTGAMYVSVKDKSTDLIESGLEFLLNFGFNVYFGGGRP